MSDDDYRDNEWIVHSSDLHAGRREFRNAGARCSATAQTRGRAGSSRSDFPVHTPTRLLNTTTLRFLESSSTIRGDFSALDGDLNHAA